MTPTVTFSRLAIAGFAALFSAGPAAQQDPAVFRSGIETVPIYATVLDRNGLMERNLDYDDFEIFDNGRRQQITTFISGLQPITAILLMDTSASMTLNLDLARRAAEQFIIRMLPGDTARIGSFNERIGLTAAFTGDRDALLASLRDDLDMGNPTRLWDALDETMAALSPLGGRRVIMLLTDGMDTASRKRAEDILARARADELMIYVVQFRSSARASLAEFPISPALGSPLARDVRRSGPAATTALRRLATQTGGGHFLLDASDDVNVTFTSVMQELHYQYVLAFTPERHDGKIHDIEVRLSQPDLVIRARQSYLAPLSDSGMP